MKRNNSNFEYFVDDERIRSRSQYFYDLNYNIYDLLDN